MSFLTLGSSEPRSADAQLIYEARMRPRYAVVAVLAAVFLMTGAILQLSGPHPKVQELTLDLITENKRIGLDLTAAGLNALGWLTLAATIYFLFGAVRARNPKSQGFIGSIAIIGGVLASVAGIVDEVLITTSAHKFATTGSQTYQQANHLTTGTAFATVPILGLLGALMIAMALVLVSLAAMRAGLLTRFMGYLGIFAGALVLFQITQVPIVQAYWLLALAYLFWGRWPTGVPPAWRTGRAEKWPSSQELREQRIRAAGQRGRGKPSRAPQPVAAPAAPSPAPSGGQPAAKRKRKRRK